MSRTRRKQTEEAIANLRVWARGGVRAPHKPLLLLLAVARATQGKPRLATFREINEPLRDLLERYGPPRRHYCPEYPFWFLQSDGLWEVVGSDALPRRKGGKGVSRTVLLKNNVAGGLPPHVHDLMVGDTSFRSTAVSSLLEAHFPSSLHDEILRDLDLSVRVMRGVAKRNAAFRGDVIRAYEHRCAVCGYDLRIDHVDLGLEAAHIKWHQAGGPDLVQNGLALCAIHHKALDRGAVGLSPELEILISEHLYGQSWADDWFLQFHRRPLLRPQSTAQLPTPDFIAWHTREVFREPARE
jgi:putative restriction endonuclease